MTNSETPAADGVATADTASVVSGKLAMGADSLVEAYDRMQVRIFELESELAEVREERNGLRVLVRKWGDEAQRLTDALRTIEHCAAAAVTPSAAESLPEHTPKLATLPGTA